MDTSDDSDMARKELDKVLRMIQEYVNMTSDTVLKEEGNNLPERNSDLVNYFHP